MVKIKWLLYIISLFGLCDEKYKFFKICNVELIWPWSHWHIYVAIKKAFNSRYGMAQVQSLSSLMFLALLDLKEGLVQPFPLFSDFRGPIFFPENLIRCIINF